MCAGTELDIFPAVVHPVRDRDKAWDPEIAADVEHPKPTPVFGKLISQIADIGIVELTEVHFRPLQPIVPPDCVGIAFYQFKEALDDGLLERIAGGTAVGIRQDKRPRRR